jgi:hypothetical protein
MNLVSDTRTARSAFQGTIGIKEVSKLGVEHSLHEAAAWITATTQLFVVRCWTHGGSSPR